MRPPRPRFTIRWLMEAMVIIAIALWSLRFSRATWSLIMCLITLYYCGLAPIRRLYGFTPIRRYFVRFVNRGMGIELDRRTKDDRGMWNG